VPTYLQLYIIRKLMNSTCILHNNCRYVYTLQFYLLRRTSAHLCYPLLLAALYGNMHLSHE